MNRQNFRIYFVAAGILGIAFLVILFIPTKKQETIESNPMTSFPTPTAFEFKTATTVSTSETSSVSPLISPIDFTGVKEETLSKEISNLVIQKQKLKKNLPLQESFFTITFNYNSDNFIVVLKNPRNESQKNFEKWRTANYPAIPMDRFTILDD